MWFKEFIAILLLVGLATSASPPQGRVVNGSNAKITDYPFMVSLRRFRGAHSCGCSIIAPRWILTAAHCVELSVPELMTVQYAASAIDASGPNLAQVKRIIIHENYDPDRYYANDIALLELWGQLVFNFKTLSPVNLPTQNYEVPQVPYGSPGVLIGWGYDKTGGQIQTNLQEVELKLYSDEECKFRHNGVTTTDQICGGVDEGGKGQCSGDSGGPLLQRLPSGGLMQVGIVSWSIKPCTIYPYPGVYTKVSHYINWIHEKMNS